MSIRGELLADAGGELGDLAVLGGVRQEEPGVTRVTRGTRVTRVTRVTRGD